MLLLVLPPEVSFGKIPFSPGANTPTNNNNIHHHQANGDGVDRNPITRLFRDNIYLFGSFFFSIFPIWRPEQRPRRLPLPPPQQQLPPQEEGNNVQEQQNANADNNHNNNDNNNNNHVNLRDNGGGAAASFTGTASS
jgi:hypothetical protein